MTWEEQLAGVKELATSDPVAASAQLRPIQDDFKRAIQDIRAIIKQETDRRRQEQDDQITAYLLSRTPMPTAKAAAAALDMPLGRVARVRAPILHQQRRDQRDLEERQREEKERRHWQSVRDAFMNGRMVVVPNGDIRHSPARESIRKGDFLVWIDGVGISVSPDQPSYYIAVEDCERGEVASFTAIWSMIDR